MSAEYFLDTNLLVYAFDRRDERKRSRALELSALEEPWVISWQIVQEFSSVALHRFPTPLPPEILTEYLDVFLLPHCAIYPSASVYRQALHIHRETQYRYYDCLVVAAALSAGVSVLYSEDLQHGRRFGGMQIINPFV